MDISKVVYGVISIVVAVIVIASVLIPTIDDLTIENTTYKTLLGVTVTLSIIIPVMMAVRMISNKN